MTSKELTPEAKSNKKVSFKDVAVQFKSKLNAMVPAIEFLNAHDLENMCELDISNLLSKQLPHIRTQRGVMNDAIEAANFIVDTLGKTTEVLENNVNDKV
jgi:hypothetical protein